MTRKQKIALLSGLRNGTRPISDIYEEWPYKTINLFQNYEGYVELDNKPIKWQDALRILKTYPKVHLFCHDMTKTGLNARIIEMHDLGYEIYMPLPKPLTETEKKELQASRRDFRKSTQKAALAALEKDLKNPLISSKDRSTITRLIERFSAIIEDDADGDEEEEDEDETQSPIFKD
jgi:hypothetical protein